MKILSELLQSQEEFVFCFEFCLANGKKLCLTSNNHQLNINKKTYLPNSGIKLDSFEFNDSAHNEIILTGIFEKNGIEPILNLENSEVTILFYFKNTNQLLEWITYNFHEINYDNLSFKITLTSEIFKLHKTLLQNYSRNCRANFGDEKCKVQTALYSEKYNIISIIKSELKISSLLKPDGYYINGTAIFNNGIACSIISHIGSNITLLGALDCDIKEGSQVILTPGCDKTLATCCNIYDNAINFRGEAFIP